MPGGLAVCSQQPIARSTLLAIGCWLLGCVIVFTEEAVFTVYMTPQQVLLNQILKFAFICNGNSVVMYEQPNLNQNLCILAKHVVMSTA